MPRLRTLQTNFNAGVLDPRLAARTDLKSYYQGADTGKNVLALPQGGLKRRPGMAYQATLGAESRLFTFSFNVEQTYVMAFQNEAIKVYKDGVLQATVSTSYTLAQVKALNVTQSADTMIIVHEDHNPAKLVRGSAHTAWTLSDITLSNIPSFDFAYTNQLNGAINASVTTVTVDSTALFPSAGIILIGSEQISYSGKSSTQFTGCSRAQNGTSATSHNDDAIVTSTSENVWSDTRGWPKTAAFFQQRLWFGGSKNRPQTLWGSQIGLFFNFNVGSASADDAIDVTLDTNQINGITALMPSRHLQIFTTGGEFFIDVSPITPATIAIKNQTQFGSSTVPPVNIDGATLFLDFSKSAIREFLFSWDEDAYTANSATLLAAHLITTPVDVDALRGTANENANYVYVVNSDGTMAVLNTLRYQQVAGWTKWETTGEIQSVTVETTNVYFAVKRTINSATVYFLEKADDNTFTDANKLQTQSASTTVANLAHLNGQACRVRADSSVMSNATPSSGSITLARNGTTVEVGLDFDLTITTMPVTSDFSNGSILTEKKRLIRIVADLYESLGVLVKTTAHTVNVTVPERKFGEDILDVAPTSFTGIKEVYLSGWDRLAQVTISQTDPQPFTLLGLVVEVEA